MAGGLTDGAWDDETQEHPLDGQPTWLRVVLAIGILLAVTGLVLGTSAVSDLLVR